MGHTRKLPNAALGVVAIQAFEAMNGEYAG